MACSCGGACGGGRKYQGFRIYDGYGFRDGEEMAPAVDPIDQAVECIELPDQDSLFSKGLKVAGAAAVVYFTTKLLSSLFEQDS